MHTCGSVAAATLPHAMMYIYISFHVYVSVATCIRFMYTLA